jgi:hypothetical protein
MPDWAGLSGHITGEREAARRKKAAEDASDPLNYLLGTAGNAIGLAGAGKKMFTGGLV